MRYFLDFEKPIAELESKIDELRKMPEAEGLNIAEEVAKTRTAAAGYGPGARAAATSTAAIALNRRA